MHPHPLEQKRVNPTAEDREADEAQRRERARSIQLHMQLLVHASGCRKDNCPSANCNKMKVSLVTVLHRALHGLLFFLMTTCPHIFLR